MQDGGSRQMCQYRILLLHLLRDGGDDISRDDVRFHDDVHLRDGNAPLFPPLRLLVALCHESRFSKSTIHITPPTRFPSSVPTQTSIPPPSMDEVFFR